MKVLEAIEEKDRLILSNKKTAFETNKKLSYTVGLAAPLAPHDNGKSIPLGNGAVMQIIAARLLLYNSGAPMHEVRT